MSTRYRPMEPGDVRACAEIIARHPILGPRYGSAIRHLGSAWLKLLGSDGFVTAVFEELQKGKPVVLGAGIAAFVTDDFIGELKTAPHFWIGRELTLRVTRDESPVLSNKGVREANSRGGLNVAVWQGGVLPQDIVRGDVGNTIMAAFVELYHGYLLKETITQAEAVVQGEACRAAGGLLWDPSRGTYAAFPDVPVEKLLRQPHVIGLSRELAPSVSGSWNASMFLSYRRPQLGLSRGEQRLIACALAGRTDKEVAKKLGVSLAGIRNAWRTIYDRVGSCSPEILGDHWPQGSSSSQRGKEKKHHLLAYLHEHPEELRPVSRKILNTASFRL